jgi:hypothetical protein
MLEFIIDDVKDRAVIGIISEPIEDGGLPPLVKKSAILNERASKNGHHAEP